MPINAGPEYFVAEEEYRNAKSTSQKIRALEKMLRLAPDHKGAEKLRMQIKRRIAKLKSELDKQKTLKKGSSDSYFIKHEGAAQVVVVGPPNSGKSKLVKFLTGANTMSSDVPFTTTKPIPGMMDYGGAQIQLIDTPSIYRGAYKKDPRLFALFRNADGILLLGDDSDVLVELKSAGLVDKIILHIVNWDDSIKKQIFDALGLIRVYTKKPRNEPVMDKPLVLKKGATVRDAALKLHKDIAKNLRKAKVWGSSKFPGQPVPQDYVLHDGDVLEVHIK